MAELRSAGFTRRRLDKGADAWRGASKGPGRGEVQSSMTRCLRPLRSEPRERNEPMWSFGVLWCFSFGCLWFECLQTAATGSIPRDPFCHRLTLAYRGKRADSCPRAWFCANSVVLFSLSYGRGVNGGKHTVHLI